MQLFEIEKMRLVKLKRTMPELLAIQNKSKIKPRVRFYEGVGGMLEVYSDILKEKKKMVAFEDFEHMQPALPKSFCEWYPAERARSNILFRSITRDSEEARRLTQHNRRLLRESKLLRSADWRTKTIIYGNKVAIRSLRSKKPFCVLIEDHDIAQTLRNVWQELWNHLEVDVIG